MDISKNPKKSSSKGDPGSNPKGDTQVQAAGGAKIEAAKPVKPTPSAPMKVPPMFRPTDWFALIISFVVVWAVYLWTLAPELTLEDSGELCTGSFYAGIPHPPGYPFWAIYSYIWTVIVPFGNVAWRVEVGQSFASAMGCGLLALMVSRGGSMLIEGIEDLKAVSRRWENSICVVSGVVSALLLGLGGYMWKESVVINRISIFGVPWMLAVIALLMRWMYAPQQRRYLYLAMLCFGWCATIHQSLILCSPAVVVVIALVLPRLGRDLLAVIGVIYLAILYFIFKNNIPALQAMTNTEKIILNFFGISFITITIWLIIQTNEFFTEWFSVLMIAVMSGLGLMVYLYEPLSCMTCPPMQWGYPRTVEGFFHALSRGQYGTGEGTNVFADPRRFGFQLWYLASGLSQTFSWFFMYIGLLPFLFLHKMHRRERNWIIGITSIYLLLSVLVVIILNVSADRSTAELNMVFFTASHGVFAILVGYGMIILASYIATNYEKFRRWGFIGGAVAVVLVVYGLIEAIGGLYFGKAGQMRVSWLPFSDWGGWGFLAYGPNGQFGFWDIPHLIVQAFARYQYGMPVFAHLFLLAMPVLFLLALIVYRKRGPVAIVLALFCLAPIWSGTSHWYKSEQRNHWYGYWFGHDMFTPPFTDTDGKFSYDNARRAELMKDPAKAKLIYPEMTRDAILFGGTDPGRFCPTYIIFCESFIPHRCQPVQDQKFDRRDVYIITQNALADGTYLEYLRSQYNRSKQIDPPFFSRFFKYLLVLGTGIGSGNIATDGPDLGSGDSGNALVEGIANFINTVLDKPFVAWGQHVEDKRRAEGVYPKNEIYIPSPDDSAQCFQDYAREKQMSSPDGRIEISGQQDVMAINGKLCKVIFDNCPTNEFFVEESFPLDWMYPYETPFGVIMKINRAPVTELSDDVLNLDHAFWSKYSERLCGNWITYDTSVQQIADFVDRTYIHNNYQGFIGDRRFVRDEDAQKAFSKLRSSQAGMYAWRVDPRGCPPEYRQKTPAAQAALVRETDFAFKQAFAFCPFSPEAVFRYVNFLLEYGRFDDAVVVAKTCQKLDPFNDQVANTIHQLESIRDQNAGHIKAVAQLSQLEDMARTNPDNITNLVFLAGTYLQMQQTNRGVELLNQAVANPKIQLPEATAAAQYFGQIGYIPGFEAALNRIVALAPDVPEHRYNLAAVEAVTGRSAAALTDLKLALDLNAKRLATNPSAPDIRTYVRNDPNLNALRALPEFQKLLPP